MSNIYDMPRENVPERILNSIDNIVTTTVKNFFNNVCDFSDDFSDDDQKFCIIFDSILATTISHLILGRCVHMEDKTAKEYIEFVLAATKEYVTKDFLIRHKLFKIEERDLDNAEN